MTAEEGWRHLAAALAARSTTPPLLPERPWDGCPPMDTPAAVPIGAGVCGGDPGPVRARARTATAAPGAQAGLPAALRMAAAVVGDRPEAALAEPAGDTEALVWRAVALRRAGRFPEARRAFRSLKASREDRRLFEQALALLRATGGGFRWAAEAASQLATRGAWDSIWFVDACAAVQSGLLSRETGALLEEIQRIELQLLLGASAAGEP